MCTAHLLHMYRLCAVHILTACVLHMYCLCTAGCGTPATVSGIEARAGGGSGAGGEDFARFQARMAEVTLLYS